jgi:uncharacterized lipoprotein YmbA
MRATIIRRSIGGGAIAAALAIAGCASPPSTILTLDIAPPAADAVHPGYAGPPIAIPAVHVPAALDRVEFVRQVSAGELKVDDFARWSAPLGTLARDALVRDLTARLPAGAVLPPGATGSPGRARTFDVTILSFDTGGGAARMQIAYRALPDGRVRPELLTTTLSDDTPLATANAFTTLLGTLADRIADGLSSR